MRRPTSSSTPGRDRRGGGELRPRGGRAPGAFARGRRLPSRATSRIMGETQLRPAEPTPVNVVDARDTEFTRLIERFYAGDPAAVGRLYGEYGGVVREAVRRRLPDRLRKEY